MDSNFKDSGYLIIICPICGFSFKPAISVRKQTITCPMCGYKFKSMELNPNRVNNNPDKLI